MGTSHRDTDGATPRRCSRCAGFFDWALSRNFHSGSSVWFYLVLGFQGKDRTRLRCDCLQAPTGDKKSHGRSPRRPCPLPLLTAGLGDDEPSGTSETAAASCAPSPGWDGSNLPPLGVIGRFAGSLELWCGRVHHSHPSPAGARPGSDFDGPGRQPQPRRLFWRTHPPLTFSGVKSSGTVP